MTNELREILDQILEVLETQNKILRYLLEESNERNNPGHTIFDDMDEETHRFFSEALHGKTME